MLTPETKETLERLLEAGEIAEVKKEGPEGKVTVVKISRKVVHRDAQGSN